MSSPKTPSFATSSSDVASLCADAIARLVDLKINFLAIDFDQTILDIHTGGQWRGSVQELAPHVRPLFRHLIQGALDANIKVAIVTFSPQVGFIREILEINFPGQSNSIPIRGRDKSWSYGGKGSREGKQAHIASAVDEIEQYNNSTTMETTTTTKITKKTTILIDDDMHNIKIALMDGVRAIWLNPTKPELILDHLRNLI